MSGSVNVNEMIPGVSRRVTLFKTGLLVVEHWNLTKDQCWSMPLLSPGEEGSPVVLEMCVRFLCVNSQHIARDVPILFCHCGRLECSDLNLNSVSSDLRSRPHERCPSLARDRFSCQGNPSPEYICDRYYLSWSMSSLKGNFSFHFHYNIEKTHLGG